MAVNQSGMPLLIREPSSPRTVSSGSSPRSKSSDTISGRLRRTEILIKLAAEEMNLVVRPPFAMHLPNGLACAD